MRQSACLVLTQSWLIIMLPSLIARRASDSLSAKDDRLRFQRVINGILTILTMNGRCDDRQVHARLAITIYMI